jgi:hypothetical protein
MLSRNVGKELPLHEMRNSNEERGSYSFRDGNLKLLKFLSLQLTN